MLHRFAAPDGAAIAYREIGSGPTVVLIHGFLSTGVANWLRFGHAAAIAGRGFRVVMPDLRGHGDSARPHDLGSYPPDALTDDCLALLEHLELQPGEYDLGGYSLGSRTSIRMLVRGAAPRRAVLAGMGLGAIVRVAGRGEDFRRILNNPGSFAEGTREARVEAFMRSVDADPAALLGVLGTIVDTPREELQAIATLALVLCGAEDPEAAAAAELAAVLPDGRYEEIGGDHTTAVTGPGLGAAIAGFLSAPAASPRAGSAPASRSPG
jgi:pimeloyl-ACP methyl ester carboxylesterase